MKKSYEAPSAEVSTFLAEEVLLGASIVDPGKGEAPSVDVVVPLF
jgi:hypothetical protein